MNVLNDSNYNDGGGGGGGGGGGRRVGFKINNNNNNNVNQRTIMNNKNNNNNNNSSFSSSTPSKKSVRFAGCDELQIQKTGFTNTFKIGEYCKKCGSLRVGPFVDNGCKNCEIIASRPKTVTSNDYYYNSNTPSRLRKSEFLRSLGVMGADASTSMSSQSPSSSSTTQHIEIENEIPEILGRLSAGENIQQAVYNTKPVMPVKPRTSLTNNNNQNQPRFVYKCHACNGILQPGEIAIMAEKVDKNLRWHPGCFACTICNQLLVDLLYFNIGSDVYCEKHFDELISWRKCAACDMPIKSNEYVCAENNYWHIEHFVCWNCDCSLAGQKYTVVDSMPYCFSCHERIYAKTCQSCKKKILPDQVRLAYEKLNWHSDPSCFKCHVCNVDLLESHFLLKNNHLFCSLECKKKAVKN